MDARYTKILQYIADFNTEGKDVNITPVLVELFPLGVSGRIQSQSADVKDLLTRMKDASLLTLKSKSIVDGLGNGNKTNGYSAIQNTENTKVEVKEIIVSITADGLEYLTTIDEKKLSIELLNDNLLTNKSNRELNEVTKESIKTQETLQKINMGLGFVTLLFIVISSYIQMTDNTDTELVEIRKQFQELNRGLKTIHINAYPLGLPTNLDKKIHDIPNVQIDTTKHK